VSSRFAIVGPAADPAHVAGATSAADAMRRIATTGGAGAGGRAGFVSRGDSSGTHVKEVALWEAAGVSPAGRAWYVPAGTDQAATLRLADERGTYALADLPTFARFTGIDLRVLFTADSALVNPYTLYVIRSSAPHPAAARFAPWALAAWRERLLTLRLPDGTAAFATRAGGCVLPA
jgi:tungstate transport system substrate-binding protein